MFNCNSNNSSCCFGGVECEWNQEERMLNDLVRNCYILLLDPKNADICSVQVPVLGHTLHPESRQLRTEQEIRVQNLAGDLLRFMSLISFSEGLLCGGWWSKMSVSKMISVTNRSHHTTQGGSINTITITKEC